MSFAGKTEERLIKTNGKTYKLFMTEQDNSLWVATILYAVSSVATTHNEADTNKSEAYRKACEWVLNNIDGNAIIDTL